MSCGFDKEKLTGYFDGELEAAGKAEVERHIGACSECLRELGEIKSSAQLVKGLPRLRAPRSIAEGVSREISASGGKVASFDRSRRRLGWLTAAAAAAFVAVNITYFAGLTGRQEAPPRSAAPLIGSTDLAKGARVEERAQRRGVEKAESADGKRAEDTDLKPVLRDAAPVPAEAKKDNRALAEKLEKAKEAEAPKADPAKAPAPQKKEEDRAALAVGKPAAPSAPAPATALPPAPPAPGAAAPVARTEAARKQVPLPETLTLASTKLTASRAKFEEIFKKYGAELPEANSKLRTASPGGLRSVSLALTPERLEALKLELEKVGNARLLAVAPEDPSLAKLQKEPEGAAKKAVASGGASRSKDSLGFGAKVAARESGKDEAGQRVVIHLLEVSELPPVAAPPADQDK